jgi:hypothetical protein
LVRVEGCRLGGAGAPPGLSRRAAGFVQGCGGKLMAEKMAKNSLAPDFSSR